MREFTSAHGYKFDLDDPKTYAKLSQNIHDVLKELYKEIGYAVLYMRGHNWERLPSGKEQVDRIEIFINEIAGFFGGKLFYQPLIFWQEKLFLFKNEIENMC